MQRTAVPEGQWWRQILVRVSPCYSKCHRVFVWTFYVLLLINNYQCSFKKTASHVQSCVQISIYILERTCRVPIYMGLGGIFIDFVLSWGGVYLRGGFSTPVSTNTGRSTGCTQPLPLYFNILSRSFLDYINLLKMKSSVLR